MNFGIAPMGAMLLLSLGLMAYMNPWTQAFGLSLMFVCMYARLGVYFWPLCLLWHWSPLLISAESLDEINQDPSWIYYLAQSSPVYSILRPFQDPWIGEWIYGDSPFHFTAEPWTTYELWYVHLPISILLMTFRGQKSV